MKKQKNRKQEIIKDIIKSKRGITLVALVVTIIVLLILAGVSITVLIGDDGILRRAENAANATNDAVQDELAGIESLESTIGFITDKIDPETGWNLKKVTKVESDDGVIVPVPKGFIKSEVEGEGSVATGFVIKQGTNALATSGVNEFVWIPVDDTSEMFGTDSNGNSFGKLYDFQTTSSPSALNWTENGWEDSRSVREPDVMTKYDGADATEDSSYFISAIGNIQGNEFKKQLQSEFEDMRESVETYGGFYIGRYETGIDGTVQKNNFGADMNGRWYAHYKRCKTIVNETSVTSSMIWGCQWDATLRYFLKSSDEDVRKYVTDSSGMGQYNEEGDNTYAPIRSGSNDNYKVNNIYDMAGNVREWTLEGSLDGSRVARRRRC